MEDQESLKANEKTWIIYAVFSSKTSRLKDKITMISIVPLILILIVLAIITCFIKKLLKYKSEREKKAIQKSLIAYFLTDSLLISWLVYKKNNPKDHL